MAAFIKTRPELATPDVQYHILPATMDLQKMSETGDMELEKQPGLTIAPCQLRPESRGSVHIKSAKHDAHPAIRPNYLYDPLDQQTAVAGLRWARDLAAQPALARYIEHELEPGEALRVIGMRAAEFGQVPAEAAEASDDAVPPARRGRLLPSAAPVPAR